MVSGAIGGFLDVAFNLNAQAFLDDNLLGQFFRIGWKMAMFGDDTSLKLSPQLFARHDGVSSFFVKDTVQVDLNVSRHMPEELNQDDWRLLLVVSDHGMTDCGSHGGSSYEETDSLALFIGSNFKFFGDASQSQDTINQVDIAPTLALLFGVPIPKNNVGVLPASCLQFLTVDHRLRALELNSWQLLRLLKAQLPSLSCADSDRDDPGDNKWSKVGQCNGPVEEIFCCLYSKAADLHCLWKTTVSSSDGGLIYSHTITAYYEFLTAASEWLTRRVTDGGLRSKLAKKKKNNKRDCQQLHLGSGVGLLE